eukprot:1196280-Prorocentrum_minimum.AAC.5
MSTHTPIPIKSLRLDQPVHNPSPIPQRFLFTPPSRPPSPPLLRASSSPEWQVIQAPDVPDGPMNADIGLNEADMLHHHVDADMAARLGAAASPTIPT